MTPRPWTLPGDNEWLTYWEYAAPHRQTLTDLILASCGANSAAEASICVWGAGSCHDLDLRRLVEHVGSLTLVDINANNLAWGVEYQLGEPPSGVQTLTVDLCGSSAGKPAESLASTLLSHSTPELGSYDLIVSAGMLSQIVLDVVEKMGGGSATTARPLSERSTTDSQLAQTLVAARRRHAGLMLDHLKPGGAGLIVVDLINSDDAPEIATAEDLAAAVATAQAKMPHSHILDPGHLQHDLLKHFPLSKRVSGVAMSNYWLWRMTERHYACYAMRFGKKG